MAKKKTEDVGQVQDVGQAADTLVDLVVDTAIDLVNKRQVAAQAARQHDLGPGGVNEAMKAVAAADTLFTQAVLALVEVEAGAGADGGAGAGAEE